MPEYGICGTCEKSFEYDEFFDDEAKYMKLKTHLKWEKFLGIPLFILFLLSFVYLAGVLIADVDPWATAFMGITIWWGGYGLYSVIRIIYEYNRNYEDRFKIVAREINGQPKCLACIARPRTAAVRRGAASINESSSLTAGSAAVTGSATVAEKSLGWKGQRFMDAWTVTSTVVFLLAEMMAMAFFFYFTFSLKEKEFRAVAVGSSWSVHLTHSFRIEACVYAGLVLFHQVLRMIAMIVGKLRKGDLPTIVDCAFAGVSALYFVLAGSIPWMVLGRTLTLPWKLRALIFLFCFQFLVSITCCAWFLCVDSVLRAVLKEVFDLAVWKKLKDGRCFFAGSAACNVIYFAHVTVVLILAAFFVTEMFRITGPKTPYCSDCRIGFRGRYIDPIGDQISSGNSQSSSIGSGWSACEGSDVKFSHDPIRLVSANFNVKFKDGKDYHMTSCAIVSDKQDVSQIKCDQESFVIDEMLQCSASKSAFASNSNAIFFLTASEHNVTVAFSERSAAALCQNAETGSEGLLWCSTELFLTQRPEVSCIEQSRATRTVKYLFHWP